MEPKMPDVEFEEALRLIWNEMEALDSRITQFIKRKAGKKKKQSEEEHDDCELKRMATLILKYGKPFVVTVIGSRARFVELAGHLDASIYNEFPQRSDILRVVPAESISDEDQPGNE
jgi:hypothetical protein